MIKRTGHHCENDCNDNKEPESKSNCMDHSGIKTMISIVLVGIVAQLGLQTYNNFYAIASIKTSIVEIRNDFINLRNEMKSADYSIDRRVASLEDFVYKRK